MSVDATGTSAGTAVPPGITLCGIGDEAGASLDEQVSALTTLGWGHIELRNVDGTAVADLDDAAFDRLVDRLAAADLTVTCVDSRIANWGRPITADFDADLRELDALGERCHRLGTRNVRVMSYPNDGLSEADWRQEVLTRMGLLAARAEQAGLVLLHENCAGWAGTEAARMRELLAEVDSPALRLLFDVGNGVAYDYEAYDLLPTIAPYVEHVHIKDAIGTPEDASYLLPGDGRCRVQDSLRYLLDQGYTGVWSIEPHINVRPHESLATEGKDGVDAFVEYGRALERMVARLAGERA